MSRPLVVIEGAAKAFGSTVAVDNVNLTVEQGEFFALLGPSGCGKTTLLRMIAGLEIPTAGRLLIDGQDMAGAPPNRRPVNMVFQSYALFPHMSVADNIGYGLKAQGMKLRERTIQVEAALTLVRMEGLDARRPAQLSGGQRQRVALARALVKRPKVLLLDEPLSALDAKLREQMRVELKRVQREVGVTFLMVTHDQSEALALADRCAVMDRGRLEQVGTPSDLYDRPASRLVADFIGQVNLFGGRVVQSDGAGAVLDCPELGARVVMEGAAGGAVGEAAWLSVRPEQVALEPTLGAVEGGLDARVLRVAYLGAGFAYDLELPGGKIVKAARAHVAGREVFVEGQQVRLSWPKGAASLLLR